MTIVNEHVFQINVEQTVVYQEVLTLVNEHNGTTFFLDGLARIGKTFLYNTITVKLCSEEKIVICVTSYGIVALLLDFGQTSHFTFKLPIQINEDSICAIHKTSNHADLLRKTTLIIWDEIHMQHYHCPKVVDHMLCDLRDDGRTLEVSL
jgi:hypothetical protein